MGHYAKVLDGKVMQVIVAEEDFFDAFVDETSGQWIQTSYNTSHGVHIKGGTPLRKNFAGVGDVYDKERDAFYAQQPFPSWTLNESTCKWEPPIETPDLENSYYWDEETLSWILETF